MTGTPKQARRAIAAIFFLNGLVFGEWGACIHAMRDRVGRRTAKINCYTWPH